MKKITLSKLKELNKYLKSFAYFKNEKIFYIGELTLKNINDFLNIPFKELEEKSKKIKTLKNINFETILTNDQTEELFLELGYDFEKIEELEFYKKLQYFFERKIKKEIKKRSLIITIMGHVDHGKTTLLDIIRKSSLTDKEVGSITQKLGSYKIVHNKKEIIFIDTPGHEFFNSMRQRGTEITDLVILVVSGVEGIKSQTKESINLAQKSKIPIIVFINKSDLSGFDAKKIEKQLSNFDLISTKWGGNTIFLEGSAKKNIGTDKLLDVIFEQEKKINPIVQSSKFGSAIVLDSFFEKSGPIISVIIKTGTLKVRDPIIVSNISGRIKMMKDDKGKEIKIANVGDCVFISGLFSIPLVGSIIYSFESDQMVKIFSEFTLEQIKEKKNKILKSSFDDFFKKQAENKVNIILKIDTKGSEEAILQTIEKLLKIKRKNELNFIIMDVGDLTINEVKLAEKTKSFILIYNLKIKSFILKEMKSKFIQFFEYQLIYELIDKLEDFLDSKHIKQEVINVIGKMKVTNIFSHSKFGVIAGGIVVFEKISKSKNFLRVIRNDEIIIDKQKILTIRHEKDEIDTAVVKQTCGILFKKKFEFKVDDIIEQYEMILKEND